MNGESAFGWAKVVAIVFVFALVVFVIYELVKVAKKIGGATADVAKQAAAKVEDTRQQAGSGVADFFEWLFMRKTDAAINAMKKGAPASAKPVGIDVEDLYVGDLPVGDIALPNPRTIN